MDRPVHDGDGVRVAVGFLEWQAPAIVLKAMHRIPDSRYRTVAELIGAIRGLLRKSGVILAAMLVGVLVLAVLVPRDARSPGAKSSDTAPVHSSQTSPM